MAMVKVEGYLGPYTRPWSRLKDTWDPILTHGQVWRAPGTLYLAMVKVEGYLGPYTYPWSRLEGTWDPTLGHGQG